MRSHSANAPPGKIKQGPLADGPRFENHYANDDDFSSSTTAADFQSGGPRHISVVLTDVLAMVCERHGFAADGDRL